MNETPNTTPSPQALGAAKAMHELQAKVDGEWRTLRRHESKDYLEIIGLKQFSRHKKQRILKLK